MLKNILTLILMLVGCGFAVAGDGSGRVTTIMVHEGDVMFFALDTHMGAPACNPNGQWAVSLASQKGRAMYAMLLSAQARSAPVYVKGAGDCADWGDRERPLYMWQ